MQRYKIIQKYHRHMSTKQLVNRQLEPKNVIGDYAVICKI